MKRSDIYVRPTREDAFPIAIIEALLHGIPCVGTQVGNQGWMIGTAGLCVPPGDSSALADALEQVVKHYERFKAEVPIQLERVRAYFDWDDAARRILGFMADDE
jgi:glycosyltransferase involved in cell wall biosynthesis